MSSKRELSFHPARLILRRIDDLFRNACTRLRASLDLTVRFSERHCLFVPGCCLQRSARGGS
ncbi:hypothetical protein BRAO285_1120015 [Bradyrhizobium sp. ORS 285]|nr:hypothetical protein BRAO285_1120015 [Bradyrhizobium sp. ORS 285]